MAHGCAYGDEELPYTNWVKATSQFRCSGCTGECTWPNEDDEEWEEPIGPSTQRQADMDWEDRHR